MESHPVNVANADMRLALSESTIFLEKTILGSALVNDIKMIHNALNEMRSAQEKPPLPPLQSTYLSSSENGTRAPDSPQRSNSDVDQDPLVEQDFQVSTVEADIDRTPIRSLYQITRLKSLRSHQISPPSTKPSQPEPPHRDVISLGILQYADAGRLVQIYLNRSNHYLYDVAGKYNDLDSIRSASPLLLVAICAVGALQDASADRLYRMCHRELRRLTLDFVFKPSMDLEDLRGLVIAGFWLSDISWSVSGLAIRRALEVDLQNTFGVVAASARPDADPLSTAPAQDLETAVERMKLWYLLYICDQHLSILYARTPMLGNQESIRNFETYLNAMPDSVCNQRFMSQVSLLRTLRAASDLFGVGGNKRIPAVFKSQLDNFNSQIDSWAGEWLSCYSNHPIVGDYPSKAVSLHYYFAKLVVCSYVFRGRTRDIATHALPVEFHDAAQTAVQCAISIIDLTIGDSDLAIALAGLPHYFHSMIAYACAFLVKTVTFHREHVDVDVEQTRDKIAKVIQLCNSTECGQHHLVRWIGRGLQSLLVNGFGATQDDNTSTRARETWQPEANNPFIPGGYTPLYPCSGDQLNTPGELDLARDAPRSDTFMTSSEHTNGIGGLPRDDFSPTSQQYYALSYPPDDINDSFFLSAGAQAHMNHFGLGLGLLK